MSVRNLYGLFEKADRADYEEGLLAYTRYHDVMVRVAQRYEMPLDVVVAAFVALSPNNDYTGNLRSLMSVLEGHRKGHTFDHVQVSTYRHAGARAWSYVQGTASFLDLARGPKIVNFYHNVLYPSDNRWVTVDGHMVAAWRGQNLTMKQAIPKGVKEYHDIAHAVKRMAFSLFLLPHQVQAIIWFVRKRTLNVKYDPQHSLFADRSDIWRTSRQVDDILPFPPRRVEEISSAPQESTPHENARFTRCACMFCSNVDCACFPGR